MISANDVGTKRKASAKRGRSRTWFSGVALVAVLTLIGFGCANKPYVYPSQYQRRYTDMAWLDRRDDGQIMLHANGKVIEYKGLDSLLPEFSSVPQAETFVRLAKKEAAQTMPETESWYILSAVLLGMTSFAFLGAASESGRDRNRHLYFATGGVSAGM